MRGNFLCETLCTLWFYFLIPAVDPTVDPTAWSSVLNSANSASSAVLPPMHPRDTLLRQPTARPDPCFTRVNLWLYSVFFQAILSAVALAYSTPARNSPC